MRQELVPEIVGERCINSRKDGQKLGFESSDFSFGGIAPVNMRGHQLLRYVPLFIDGYAVLCAGFVVQDL